MLGSMNTVNLHLERLRRHYEVVVKTYDQVSLLDLSHTLRIWTELKKPIESIAPAFSESLLFKTGLPARKVLRAAKGYAYVFSYMPGGVRTFASAGHLASGPGMGPHEGDFALGIAVKASPPLIELAKFAFVARDFDQPLIKALNEEKVTRCTYTPWLGAEAVRLCYSGDGGPLETVAISREMIIKRVANTLDGSHASAAGGGEVDNAFDAPVHHLLKYKVGGLPLPYFILLKVAQDILAIGDKTLRQ
jgi:hypothetical protein